MFLQVLARRALLRYFLREIGAAYEGRPSIFVPVDPVDDDGSADAPSRPKLKLRTGITFHLFCSHTPCGDASIFPKCVTRDEPSGSKRPATDDDGEAVPKRPKTQADDVHRTGAKCLIGETRQDTCLPGLHYHVVGAVRTKPGRGDRTLSVSCSDKLFRWHSSGVQVRT